MRRQFQEDKSGLQESKRIGSGKSVMIWNTAFVRRSCRGREEQLYLARWMVEETIRFIKQSYHLEDVRVLDYQRLKNLMALVPAAAYFPAV